MTYTDWVYGDQHCDDRNINIDFLRLLWIILFIIMVFFLSIVQLCILWNKIFFCKGAYVCCMSYRLKVLWSLQWHFFQSSPLHLHLFFSFLFNKCKKSRGVWACAIHHGQKATYLYLYLGFISLMLRWTCEMHFCHIWLNRLSILLIFYFKTTEEPKEYGSKWTVRKIVQLAYML